MHAIPFLRRIITSAVLLISLQQAPGASEVLVIDVSPGPGVDFTDLQAAVDAANDGDVLLIRSGIYPSPMISAKSISVIADVGASVTLLSRGGDIIFPTPPPFSDQFVIKNIPSGGLVLLSGLEVIIGDALLLENNSGSVWIEGCTVRQSKWLFGSSPAHPCDGLAGSDSNAIEVVDCNSVTIIGSSIFAPTNSLASTIGRSGIKATDSELQVFDSEIKGAAALAQGDTVFSSDATAPGAGASISGGSFFVANSTISGGDGCNGIYFPNAPMGFHECTQPGAGGNGLELEGTFVEPVRFLDVQLESGVPGIGLGACFNGADGIALLDNGVATLTLQGTSGRITRTSPVRAGESVTVNIEGTPDDFVFLFIGLNTNSALVPSWNGYALVQPQFIRALGFINQTGLKTLTGTTQASTPGTAPLTFFIQALRFNQAQVLVLDHAVSITIIDAAL